MRATNNIKFLGVIVFFITLISCSTNKDGLLTIDPLDLGEEPFTLSFLADDIEYVPFSNDMLFSAQLVNDYCIIDSGIILSTNLGVLRFDGEGGFINRIGEMGRGPGEYINSINLAVNNSLSNIYVLDRDKICLYDLEGHFVSNIPLPDSIYTHQIEMLSGKLFINCNPLGLGRYYWLITDTMGELMGSKLNPAPPVSVIRDESFFYSLGYNIFYWNIRSDTIFSVSPDLTYKPVMLFANKDLMVPDIKTIKVGQTIDFMSVEYLFETSRYVVLRFFYNVYTSALIDKRSGKRYVSKIREGILNDIDGGLSFEPRNGCFEEYGVEYLVSFVDAYTIKSHVNSEEFRKSVPKYPEKKKKLEELANSLEDNDNPVMILVKLK